MAVPWVWLYGPPGVGKSTAGFELYEQLTRRGERLAFVELDQIGMCMPAPVAARSAAKADNLLGMLDNFAAAGAEGVVVCGDLVETMREVLRRARTRPVLCRLRADDDVTVERLTRRRSLQYAMTSKVYESHDVPAGDLDVTTHPLGAHEVAAEIVRRLGPWPPAPAPATAVAGRRPGLATPVIDPSSTVLVTGPRAVGTSTVAWQVLTESVDAGHCTAYLDLEQLGFVADALHQTLGTTLANVATCWAGFRDQGAERLVLCGHLDGHRLRAMRELVPSLRIVALTAAEETLRARARSRGRKKDIWLPGDDLFGRDDDHFLAVARHGVTFDLQHADLVLETDGVAAADIAGRITALWSAAKTS